MTEATNDNATISSMLKASQADQETIAEQARRVSRLERENEELKARVA